LSEASVVVTSYNYARFLEAAIESALSQTHPETEVIVVDDGSTDGSRDVIASFGGEVTAVLKPNGGQGSAVNAGFQASRGDVVLFLDSDDVLMPRALEEAVGRFADPAVAKVQWPLREIDEAGRERDRLWPAHPLRRGDLRDDLVANGLEEHDWPPTSGNAWSRRVLLELLPVSEDEYRTSPDIYLALLARLYGRIETIDEPLSCYRVHGANAGDSIPFERQLRRIDFTLRAARDRLRELGTEVDFERWRRVSWPHRVERTRSEIERLVGDREFVLIDDEELRALLEPELKPVPFYELEEGEMIAELERRRAGGIGLAILAWPSFWWLDYYRAFATHVRRFPCLLDNERVIAFDLR
jgi:glycosyltransferase involved in cell wall biosynthesis